MRVRSRVAALVLTGLLGAACGRPGPGAVASMTVTKGTFEVVIPAFGELQAAKSTPITVSPARRGGIQTVAWIAPDYSVVKGGDVVVRLASRQLPELLKTEQAELAKIDLEIAQKEKQLEKEKDDLAGQIAVTGIQRQLADVYAARDETIYPRNKIIEDAIDLRYQTLRERYYQEQRVQIEKRIAAELALLQARAKARQVQIQQYRDQLDNLDIRAPHDGTLIISKRWDGEKTGVGMTVFPGYKLAALPDLRVMEAKVFVLESEASGLKEGLAVQLVLDYEPGRSFGGRVAGVDKIAKPLSQESPMKYFETRV
ncbi:MAG TPA: efflux RND transporter periplasmic adaptor subunit, partial [Acidobacteriota bacterium]|nr:efflux RND transporter periplasmic adaptor subunit [Acidobacteriota bacterium]